MIIDSHGRAWRLGVVGTSIGFSGMPGLVDMRGQPDLFGYHLRITEIAVADELAGAASLVMGQAANPFRQSMYGGSLIPCEKATTVS